LKRTNESSINHQSSIINQSSNNQSSFSIVAKTKASKFEWSHFLTYFLKAGREKIVFKQIHAGNHSNLNQSINQSINHRRTNPSFVVIIIFSDKIQSSYHESNFDQ